MLLIGPGPARYQQRCQCPSYESCQVCPGGAGIVPWCKENVDFSKLEMSQIYRSERGTVSNASGVSVGAGVSQADGGQAVSGVTGSRDKTVTGVSGIRDTAVPGVNDIRATAVPGVSDISATAEPGVSDIISGGQVAARSRPGTRVPRRPAETVTSSSLLLEPDTSAGTVTPSPAPGLNDTTIMLPPKPPPKEYNIALNFQYGGNAADDMLSETQRRPPDAPESPQQSQQQSQQQAPPQQPEEVSGQSLQSTVSLSERKERLSVYQYCMVRDQNKVLTC